MRIVFGDDALRWLGLDLPISHRHYDVFERGADWSIWFEDMTLQFQTDREGDIASVGMPLEPGVAPIIFRRRPEPATRTRAFLELVIGFYQRCGVTYRIALDNADQLTLTRGNGAYQVLLPSHGGTFTLPDDYYFKLEFRRDASDAVDAMLFHEADGICVVDRLPTWPR